MRAALLFLNFGEPEPATLETVVPFLERIFLTNAALEGSAGREARVRRAHELAVQRAPGLIAEYRKIGGSPMNQQAMLQAESVLQELQRRDHDVHAYVGMQFTDPTIEDVVRQARTDGAELLIVLPVYPMCGPSTTVAALEETRRAVDALGWPVPIREISGWHSHSRYLELRADAIRKLAIECSLDLSNPATRVVFSAHGTPLEYVKRGSRYVLYTEHACHAIADSLGLQQYELGYQNHSNRPVQWTQPGIEQVVASIDAEAIIVDACSFMHEQSETLAELDDDLKRAAEARGLKFYRVPIPYDAPQFIALLADLIEPFLTGDEQKAGFRACRCRATADTFCLNTVL